MEMESRLERGYRKMIEIDGEAGKKVENGLNDISPELVKYMIAYSFGDIYSREALELKAKEICVVAALTAMGNARPQLKVHINGALNVGCTISDIKEIIMQMSAYSGFPASINAMNALLEVLGERKERGIKDPEGSEPVREVLPNERYEVGAEQLAMFDSNQLKNLEKAYNDFAPDLIKFIVNGQADFYARDNFGVKYREMATVAALTAIGTAEPQLKFHMNAALNVGVAVEEIKEIILLMTIYSGFPSAINAMNILKEV
ncbi:carboxymuconolactone decarboxylase family protein [Clostridium neuense]|uniref:Carboxymuconolactone decarboxylase family protein n=1 Tax=Clostridium neuense TaxID=1728934 RepID=A0ABW8TLP0_9CLOT